MNQEFESIINQAVEETLEAPVFAQLTRPQYDQKKHEINNFFHELIVYTLFNNLNEQQLQEAESLNFATPEAAQIFAKWAAEIPGLALKYQADLKKYSEDIRLTGQLPVLE
jgi:hypothetical protein